MNGIGERVTTIAVAIVGVAMLALIVSKKANTAGVISAAAGGFSQMLGVAVSPVTSGGGTGYNGFVPQV
jgi:hypothetical protein